MLSCLAAAMIVFAMVHGHAVPSVVRLRGGQADRPPQPPTPRDRPPVPGGQPWLGGTATQVPRPPQPKPQPQPRQPQHPHSQPQPPLPQHHLQATRPHLPPQPQPAPRSAVQPAPQPAVQPAPQPAAQLAPQPMVQPAPQPAPQPAVQEAAELPPSTPCPQPGPGVDFTRLEERCGVRLPWHVWPHCTHCRITSIAKSPPSLGHHRPRFYRSVLIQAKRAVCTRG